VAYYSSRRKIKVLIQQECITHYRLDIFNLIAKYYDLTVIHQGPFISNKLILFKQEIIKIYKIGPFVFQNFFKIIKFYDVVITNANLRYVLNNLFFAYIPRKFKWIAWGIGVNASYTKNFDQYTCYNFLRYLIFKRSDALLFYSNYPIKKYLAAGINISKLHVAHNTYSNKCKFNKKRKYYIYIGSLFRGKGLITLIKKYKAALSIVGDKLPPLKIIGSGEMGNLLKKFIYKNNLKNKIKLLGPIYEKKKINKILSKALICISPKQAGLSVLQAMSCGVAFVTSKDAITGGEIFNIKHNKNGILLKDLDELEKIIIDANFKTIKYINMGKKAYEHYYKKRTAYKMIHGFKKAIESVLT
jgi:glycosyltransferase involved in cell wall biosynthesis